MANFRSAVDNLVPSTLASYRSSLPLPSSLGALADFWLLLGNSEDAVFEAANTYLANQARLTSAQKTAYATLRTQWQRAQLRLYELTRLALTSAFSIDRANVYANAFPYPGWLPSLPTTLRDVSPDMRDRDGKRFGTATPGMQAALNLEATNASAYDQMSGDFAQDSAHVVPLLADVYNVGLLAKKLKAQFRLEPASTSSAPPVVAANVIEMTDARDKPVWPFVALALAGAATLYLLFAPVSTPRRALSGVRKRRSPRDGLGAIRLKTLADPVGNKYGLQVRG